MLEELLAAKDLRIKELSLAVVAAERRVLEAQEQLRVCEMRADAMSSKFEALLQRAELLDAEIPEVHKEAIAAAARAQTLEAELRRLDRDADALRLRNGGDYAMLGLRVKAVVDPYGVQRGVVVSEVVDPAASAGVRVGDELEVVACEAAWRIDCVNDYRKAIANVPVDSDVVLHVRRGGVVRPHTMRPRLLQNSEGPSTAKDERQVPDDARRASRDLEGESTLRSRRVASPSPLAR